MYEAVFHCPNCGSEMTYVGNGFWFCERCNAYWVFTHTVTAR